MNEVVKVLGVLGPLVGQVVEMMRAGASDEEIRQRLAEPDGVGQELIDALRSRRARLDGFVREG